ncbi:MAG: PDZ domain-containing protein, partial [Maritimibacter sp.]|nr:PDZ domain-containing protein [Maritimibacter sp.]
ESPFGAAGIRPGDVVLEIGGHPVNAPAELGFRLSLQELGAAVPVTFHRAGDRQTVSVEMRAAVRAEETLDGGPVKVTGLGPFDGVVLQEIGPALRDRLGLPADRGGVIVLALDDPRQVRNFQPGDIVAEINGTQIATMEDFKAVTEAALADGKRSWKVVLNRRGGLVYLTWRG